MARKIQARQFHHEYHGHTVPHLDILHSVLRARGLPCIFLAGDSSLDNKYWLLGQGANKNAVNGYEDVLEPPNSVPDVCYWLNFLGKDQFCCINTAIEETTLGQRSDGRLLPQDKFIREHITEEDVLIVSVGGNDIALKPTLGTITNMGFLVGVSSMASIRDGSAWGLRHFIRLFRDDVRNYVSNLVGIRKPKLVVICMIYYLDQKAGGSWADGVLKMLGYNTNPGKLQLLISKVYELATKEIRIEGTKVVAFPLFECLDGKDTNDYVQRVEPSEIGGRKMAQGLLRAVRESFGSS